jgi:hypothetical protein
MLPPKAFRGALLLVALVLALGHLSLLSEGTSGLRGKVVDKVEHVAIRNAYILAHRDGIADEHARTDQNGRYSIQLSPGLYDVLISADAFGPICRKVEVEHGHVTVFDAALSAGDGTLQQ